MANNRKVQAEIDKLLKKTSEGLEEYEELYDKFDNASNPGAKERLEADLKREIKKLQRQREQIKGFVTNPDVKDTKQLEDFRKRIEEKMLEFKACEREMKTKAFSKEGLASAAADEVHSPLAQTVSWLRTVIDDGRKRIEILDYEAQRAKTGGRRGRKDQKSDAQVRLEKTQEHFHRWEALLRMLNNEELEPEDVDALASNIQSVLDEETSVADIPELAMYDQFDIPPPKPRVEAPEPSVEERKSSVPASAKSVPKKTPPASVNTAAAAKGGAAVVPATPPTAPQPPTPKSAIVAPAKAAAMAKTPASSAPAERADKSDAHGGGSLRSGAGAAGMSLEEDAEGNPEWLDDDMDAANDDTFGDEAMGDAVAGSLADMASATSKMLSHNDWESRKLELKKPASKEEKTGAAAGGPATATSPATAPTVRPANNDWEKRKLDLGRGSTGDSSTTEARPAVVAGGAGEEPAKGTAATAAAPGSTARGGDGSRYDGATVQRLLDMSLGNLPHTLDVERQRAYEPPNAIEPIPHFPQEVHPILACRDIYQRFDLETLFFIFYYHQKSFQQYFAAKQLKAHSFRYHTELKRWYQRREKPKETTATSERGAYTYFDFEDSWQLETVDNFTFEYKCLEDDLN